MASEEPGQDGEDLEADLREYGEGLGVDADVDPDLHWVVEEAFNAPLPTSWTEHVDDDGRIYFFHETSGESSWEHPMDAVYRELVGLVKLARTEQFSASEAERGVFIHQHLRQVHQRAIEGIDGWSGPYCGEDAQEFYYNVSLQVSVWENPLAQWEHELELRHSMLCRCLLPERTFVGADGTVERTSLAGERISGLALLQALQLPLELVKRIPTEGEGEPPLTPSTTRSFHTARSSRSQISSSRSKEEKRERRERRARERAERDAARGAAPVAPDKQTVAFSGQTKERISIFTKPE